MTVATLSLFRFDGLANRAWAFGQVALAPVMLRQERGAKFWKVCGSGTGEGFTPKPNWGVWAIMAAWPDEETARKAVESGPVFELWRKHTTESWTAFLAPTSSRGEWGGVNPFTPVEAPAANGPIVALTRATVKLPHAAAFWNRVPNISNMIGDDPNVMFKIGIGEVPLLHQVTFSVWPDKASMDAFARGSTPHGKVIHEVREGNWFAEELYARFRLLGTAGTWEGGDPLTRRTEQKEAA